VRLPFFAFKPRRCICRNKDWEKHGLNSEVAVAFDFERKLGVILGTWYGGENKKGVFALMNYLLPLRGVLPMHCSANVGAKGDVALFFGLSGASPVSPRSTRRFTHRHGQDDAVGGGAPRLDWRRRARLERRGRV
jgi:phosphoenolpyruvate carboxykinase (ATP)